MTVPGPMAELLDDLQAEYDDLRVTVCAGDLSADTPAAGWDVRDTVSHLVAFDAEATKAAAEPDRFAADRAEVLLDIDAFMARLVAARRDQPRAGLLADWHSGFAAMLPTFAALEPGSRLPWYGPPMSPLSFATARLMEYWAHGQDVADALGVTRTPSSRLRHIAHLGVRTRRFSYANRDLPLPAGDVRVELTGPGGGTWGEGPDRVTGTATDFALLVTQRRHRGDLALVAEGPLADGWLDIAQCFAGPPGPGRDRTWP